MEQNVDFSQAVEVDLDIPGWLPLMIEYVYMQLSFEVTLCWRVKGTSHVFKINVATVYKHHGSQIEDHFKVTLKCFREDYLAWMIQNDPRANPYHREFGRLIKVI